MGIGINVSNNQDYSYLFQSLSSSSGGMGNLNFLSDYASIRNGSYGKLLKTYYNKVQSSGTESSGKQSRAGDVLDRILEEKKNPKVSKEVKEANANLTAGLSDMKATVSTLQSDKTYTDSANGQSAKDKVVSAMKAYVSDYNDLLKAARGSTLTNKTAYVANMMSSTAANADKLSEIGVMVNGDGTLSLSEDKLKATDISKVQEMFSADDIMSYGSVIASRLRFAGAASGTGSTGATGNTGSNSTSGSGAASLKEDTKALTSDELFAKVKDKDGNETNQYNIDKIFATVKSFVNNYNKLFDTAESSSNSGVVANLAYMREKTAHNEDALKQLGISVDQKGRMTIDEDTFKKSDMSEVQEFFKDYGSSIGTNASLVEYYMKTQANAASGYTLTGEYNVQGSAYYTGTI